MGKTAEEGISGGRRGSSHWRRRRKAVTNYCRLRGGKGIGTGWERKIGRTDDDVCPKCGEEEQTTDPIGFPCKNVRRVRDERGRGRGEGAGGNKRVRMG